MSDDDRGDTLFEILNPPGHCRQTGTPIGVPCLPECTPEQCGYYPRLPTEKRGSHDD